MGEEGVGVYGEGVDREFIFGLCCEKRDDANAMYLGRRRKQTMGRWRRRKWREVRPVGRRDQHTDLDGIHAQGRRETSEEGQRGNMRPPR